MLDPALSAREQSDLRTLAALMIPASKKFDVPGADDLTIFSDIVASMSHELSDIRAALKLVSGMSDEPLSALAQVDQMAVVSRLRANGGSAIDTLIRHILLCYYRDDRVMRSLGIEPRPPFPVGFLVEQGDWSLLDPVKARAPFWRPAS
jgi:hypothetical protein